MTKYRQYVIVPKKPRMSVGKIASQVAHSTFMALEKTRRNIKEEWKNKGMCVIVLECKDTVQILGIAKYLEQWKVPYHLYIDEGYTEVEFGTPTSLATGVIGEDTFWIFERMNTLK